MNKFIAVIAILMMTGISTYVLAQTSDTKAAETKPVETKVADPAAAAATPAPTPAATTPAAAATPAAPAAATSTVAVAPADAAAVANIQGNTIYTRGGNMIVMPRRGNCNKFESGSVEVTFQYSEEDVSGLSKEIDAKVANVKSEANKLDATAEMADLNYNVNSGRNFGNGENENAKYHINGNVHFNISPADKAVLLLQALSANKDSKDHVTLNYRMNAGNCPQGMAQ